MSRSTAALTLLLSGLGAAGGCAGGALPVTHYYTLAPPPAAPSGGELPISTEGLAIAVEPFAVDPPYDQDRIVYRASRDASEVGFYAYHRWAAPVGRLVQSALVDGLSGTAGLREIEAASSTGDYDARLGGRVRYLEHIDGPAGHEARVAVEIWLRDDSATLWSAELGASTTGDVAGASKVAELLGRAFEELVDDTRERLAAALARSSPVSASRARAKARPAAPRLPGR